ncbi:hypothetical protein COO72_05335 [Bifidobacterium callitrichos]|nr:hypothetical protein COO72_05335 [Bifidobacterium callitrichos]
MDHDILPAEHINVLGWAMEQVAKEMTDKLRSGVFKEIKIDIPDEEIREGTKNLAKELAELNAQQHGGDASDYEWSEPRRTDWSAVDITGAFNAYIFRTDSFRDQEDSDLFKVFSTAADHYLRETGATWDEWDAIGDVIIDQDTDPSVVSRHRYLDALREPFRIMSLGFSEDSYNEIWEDPHRWDGDDLDIFRFMTGKFGAALNREINEFEYLHPYDDSDYSYQDIARIEHLTPLLFEAFGFGPRATDATPTDRTRAASLMGAMPFEEMYEWDIDRKLQDRLDDWVSTYGDRWDTAFFHDELEDMRNIRNEQRRIKLLESTGTNHGRNPETSQPSQNHDQTMGTVTQSNQVTTAVNNRTDVPDTTERIETAANPAEEVSDSWGWNMGSETEPSDLETVESFSLDGPAYPDPINRDPYMNPAGQAPDTNTLGQQPHGPAEQSGPTVG